MKNKLIYLALAIALLFTGIEAVAKEKKVASYPEVEKQIKEIKEKYSKIQKEKKTYQKRVYNGTGDDGENITYNVYVNETELKIIDVEVSGPGDAGSRTEIYYDKFKNFFVLESSESSTALANGKFKTDKSENRYYFTNGKMIRWINEKTKEVDPKSDEFIRAAAEIKEKIMKISKDINKLKGN
ncbi:MAG: hypothetical protein NT007_06425 [Candidatus Kapabacteria bacterium]|nr:hypothetical protein [Candidatus Kapabacteria bacterium]